MPDPVNIFCHWSAQFTVELVPPEAPAGQKRVRFTPVKVSGKPVLREWFATWHRQSLTGKPVPELLDALVKLSGFPEWEQDTEEFTQAFLTAAQRIGPLFTAMPWHGLAENAFYDEPVVSWHQAARQLAQLVGQMERLKTVSRDGSKTARKRRALKEAEVVYGEAALQAVDADRRRAMIAPYRPAPGIAPVHDVEQEIAAIMDHLWLVPLANAHESDWRLSIPRPRLSEANSTLQLNIPLGIQALMIMLTHDQRLGRTVLLRTCARPDCRVVGFMRSSQQYCSEACRSAEAARRHRAKQRAAKEAKSKRSKAVIGKVSQNA